MNRGTRQWLSERVLVGIVEQDSIDTSARAAIHRHRSTPSWYRLFSLHMKATATHMKAELAALNKRRVEQGEQKGTGCLQQLLGWRRQKDDVFQTVLKSMRSLSPDWILWAWLPGTKGVATSSSWPYY